MLNFIACLFFGHKTVRTGVMSHLCLRCDRTVYEGPVVEQGRRWRRRKYAERHDSRPKFAVAS